ncbi:hypothetical protein LINPERHAP1_LOCUS30977 [Linum perenne]
MNPPRSPTNPPLLRRIRVFLRLKLVFYRSGFGFLIQSVFEFLFLPDSSGVEQKHRLLIRVLDRRIGCSYNRRFTKVLYYSFVLERSLVLVVNFSLQFPAMASGSDDGGSHSPPQSVSTGDAVVTSSSTSSSSDRHNHELTVIDRSGQTKVIKIKFKDHRRATVEENKILFNLDNLGVQPVAH